MPAIATARLELAHEPRVRAEAARGRVERGPHPAGRRAVVVIAAVARVDGPRRRLGEPDQRVRLQVSEMNGTSAARARSPEGLGGGSSSHCSAARAVKHIASTVHRSSMMRGWERRTKCTTGRQGV